MSNDFETRLAEGDRVWTRDGVAYTVLGTDDGGVTYWLQDIRGGQRQVRLDEVRRA